MITKTSKTLAAPLLIAGTMSLITTLPVVALEAHQHQTFSVCEEAHGGRNYQVTRAVVKVRPEQVWHILSDYNQAPLVFPTLKKCQLISDHGGHKVVQHEVRPSGLMKSFTYVLEIKETSHRMMEWHRVSGDFKEVEGFFKLESLDGGRATQVTYATYVNGGFFMPQALIKRQFKIDMPQVMIALKDHAEKTVHIAHRRDARTP